MFCRMKKTGIRMFISMRIKLLEKNAPRALHYPNTPCTMKTTWFFLCICLLFWQCGPKNGSPASDTSAECTLQPLTQCETVTDLTPYIDTVGIVRLEAIPESMLGETSKLLLRPDGALIFLTHSGILAFDSHGKHLFRAGRVGHGPGEYIKLNDICLTTDGTHILALSAFNDILKYKADDGTYVETLTLTPRLDYSCDGIAPGPDGGFYLYAGNGADVDDFDTPFDCLKQYDATGQLLEASLPRKELGLQVAAITQSAGNRYILRPQEGDRVAYRTDTAGRFVPWIEIDFEEQTMPSGFVKALDGPAWMHLQEFLRADYYKLPIYLEETSDAFYFSAAGPEAQTHEFLYLRPSGQAIRWTQPVESGSTPFIILCSDDEWFYGLYDDPTAYDETSQATLSPLKRHLARQVGSGWTDAENPPLVKIRFKAQ